MAKVFNIGGNTISYGGFLLRELGSGSLTISKTVSGSGFDPTKTFELMVVFSAPVTYNGTTSTTHTFNLAHGQSVTITGIPELTEYEVTETPLSQQDISMGYSVDSVSGGTGSISNNGTYYSSALNSYSTPTLGRLSITKRISGNYFNTAQQFEVVVTFGSAISYSVDGVVIPTPSNTFTANIKHNQTIVLGNIPDGTTYSVVETALPQELIDEGYSAGTIIPSSGTIYNNTLTEVIISNSYSNPTGHTFIFEFDDPDFDPSAATDTYGTVFHPYAGTGSHGHVNWGYWTKLSSSPNVWAFDSTDNMWKWYGGAMFTDINGYRLFSTNYSCPNVKLVYANTGGVPNPTTVSFGILFTNANKLTDVVWYYLPDATKTLSFSGCSSLKSVPLFDTSGFKSISFSGCALLESVPLFDTSSMTSLSSCFHDCMSLTEIPAFDTKNVRSFDSFAYNCYDLTDIPLLDTSSATDVDRMFRDCLKVERGSLALYTQMSTQANPPTSHSSCFLRCGRDTITGAAELAQIPASWGGTGT